MSNSISVQALPPKCSCKMPLLSSPLSRRLITPTVIGTSPLVLTLLLLFVFGNSGMGSKSHNQQMRTQSKRRSIPHAGSNWTASTHLASIPAYNETYHRARKNINKIAPRSSDIPSNRNSTNTEIPNFDELSYLTSICILWSSSCSGNRSLSIEKFFPSTLDFLLQNNHCFINQPMDNTNENDLGSCTSSISPELSLQYREMKSWMRSPQCSSEQAARSSAKASKPPGRGFPKRDGNYDSCCLHCIISAQNVDVYYWQEANVSTTCQSIIGNETHPFDFGATTATSISSNRTAFYTYWGCTGHNSQLTTTASVTNINSILYKIPLYNPWYQSPCAEPASSFMTGATSSTATPAAQSIRLPTSHGRAPPSITNIPRSWNNESAVTTAKSGNFTL